MFAFTILYFSDSWNLRLRTCDAAMVNHLQRIWGIRVVCAWPLCANVIDVIHKTGSHVVFMHCPQRRTECRAAVRDNMCRKFSEICTDIS